MKPLPSPEYLDRLTHLLALPASDLEAIHRADPTAIAFLAHLGGHTAGQLRDVADLLAGLSSDAQRLLRSLPSSWH